MVMPWEKNWGSAQPDESSLNPWEKDLVADRTQHPKRTALDVIRDVGVTALKGAVSLPEAFVGLADIPTGGRVGKALEEVGYRPAEAKRILDGLYSDAQQEANRKVQEAEGFAGTLKAAIENPSTIATAVGESIPQMLGGAGVARGVLKIAPKVGAVAAGAAGEGILGAGAAAEQIRSESKDGLLDPVQSAAALGSGVGTGVLGFAGGKIAQRLGVGDVDTLLAGGTGQATAKGFARQVVEAGISEGVFEELPQSAQEQMWQNFATGKPIMDGVGKQSAMGLLAGAAMGGTGGGYHAATGGRQPPAKLEELQAPTELAVEPSAPQALPADTAAAPAPQAATTHAAAPTDTTQGADITAVAPHPDPFARLAELELESGRRELLPSELAEAQSLVVQLQGEENSVAGDSADEALATELPGDASAEVVEQEHPPAMEVASIESGNDIGGALLPEVFAPLPEKKAAKVEFKPARIEDSNGVERDGFRAEFDNTKGGNAYIELAVDGDRVYPSMVDNGMFRLSDSTGGAISRAYGQAVEFAEQNGKVFTSDDSVTISAARLYDSLERKGYSVQKSPAARLAVPPEVITDRWVTDDGSPVFTVSKLPRAMPAQRLSPEHAAQVAEIDGRLAAIAADHPNRTPAVQASLERSAARLRAERAEITEQAQRSPQPQAKDSRGSQAPIMKRDDLVGAIMRVTGGRGIAASMAQTVTGDTANRVSKLRGLFSGQGVQDLDDTAMLLREEEGYDVRDGEHLAELLREAAAGNVAVSMERAERDADEHAARQHRDAIRERARELGVKTVARRFDDIERDVIAAEQKANADEAEQERLAIQAEAEVSEVSEDTINELLRMAAADNDGRHINDQWITDEQILEAVEPIGESEEESAAPHVIATAGREAPGNRSERGGKARHGQGGSGRGRDKAVRQGDKQSRQGDGAAELTLTGQTNEEAAADFARQQQGEPELTKDQIDREASGFSLQQKSQANPKQAPTGGQGGLFSADGRATAAATGNARGQFESRQSSVDQFVVAPDGSVDFGEITPEMSAAMRRQAGKIRLTQGVQNSDGSGYGLAHIEARHGAEIRGSGYSSIEEFVFDAVRNIDAIWQPGATSQLVAVQSGKKGKVMFLELQPSRDEAGDYYRVNSAFPADAKYVARKERKEKWSELWSRYPVPAGASGAISGFADRSPNAGETAPTVSPQSDSSIGTKEPRGNGENQESRSFQSVRPNGGMARVRYDMVAGTADAFRQEFKGATALDIRVVNSRDEIPPHHRPSPYAEGVYHDLDGVIYLVAKNLPTKLRTWQVLMHETVGHYGLASLMGEKFSDLWQTVLTQANASHDLERHPAPGDADYATVDAVRLLYPEADDNEIAQEVLARMAETMNPPSWARAALAKMRQWLKSAAEAFGLTWEPTLQDARDLVVMAAEHLRHGDNLERLPAGQDLAFASRSGNPMESRTAAMSTAANRWQKAKAKVRELTSPENMDTLIYNYQDKMIDLKRLRDRIKALQGTITDLNDAYLGEELYHGRVAKRTEEFLADELKPLLADLRASGIGMAEFEEFLHARHAPEANAELAKRNPDLKEIEAGRQKAAAEVKTLETQLQSAQAAGKATKAIEQALNTARGELAKWNGAQAFHGTEEERLSLSGMSDAEAAAVMANIPAAKRANFDALAARVDAINDKTLKLLEQYGLMDKASLDAWRAAYQHYVPLHRDEAHPDSGHHPVGQGFSVKGEAAKRRTGSNEKVTHILGHIAMQREAALTRGEKNNVTKKLYLMAAQNPDKDFWSVDKPPMIKTVDKSTGFVRSSIDPIYKNKPNVVMLRIAGKDAAIVFNEHNKEAVRLAGALKNLDAGDMHWLLGFISKGTRWFASINTQYNPIFGLINLARDAQAGILNLGTTAIADRKGEVAGGILPAMRAIYRAERGKSIVDPAWTKLWDEFQEVGGQTGYRDLYANAEDRTDALLKELKSLDRGQVGKAVHAVADLLSDYNSAMENAVRLSAYKAALDKGLSKERAASIAKNLTVNFNRKGAQAREIGALYAFFNASIQGTARMAETLAGPVGKKIIYGGVALGVLQALLGMALMGGGDDDEWEKIPEFIKERSIIIPLSNEDFITIPLPLGFHVLPNIGRLATEFAFGGKDKTAGRQVGKLLGILAEAFNPIGSAGISLQTPMPTVFDPFVALAENRDWTGKPIYRENRSANDQKPGHALAKDSASTFSKEVTKAINAITGGNEYRPGGWSPTPDQLDYIIGQLTGGVGRELMKLEQTVTAPFTGDELPPHKIPLLGRLYGNTRGASGNVDKFNDNIRELNEIENEAKGRAEDRNGFREYLDSEPKIALIGPANAAENQVQKLRTYRRELVRRADPGYKDEVKMIDERIGQVMKDLNRRVAEQERAGG